MTRRLDVLQKLRAAAALAVLVTHLLEDIKAHGGFGLTPFSWTGAAGVDLFFVISGFVMVYTTANAQGGVRDAMRFMAKRLARIVPLYWSATALYAVLQVTQGKWDVVRPGRMMAALLFWPATDVNGLLAPVYGVGWTLNFELFFYTVFAIGLATQQRWALPAAGLCALVLTGLLVPLATPLRFWADPIALDFIIGMAIGVGKVKQLQLPVWLCLATVACAVACFAISAGSGYAAGLPGNSAAWPRCLIWGLPSGLLTAALVLSKRPLWSRPGPLTSIGDASYALYLLHPLVIITLRPTYAKFQGWAADTVSPAGFATVAQFMLCTAAVLLAALCVYRGFERPITDALNGRLKRTTAAEKPSVTA